MQFPHNNHRKKIFSITTIVRRVGFFVVYSIDNSLFDSGRLLGMQCKRIARLFKAAYPHMYVMVDDALFIGQKWIHNQRSIRHIQHIFVAYYEMLKRFLQKKRALTLAQRKRSAAQRTHRKGKDSACVHVMSMRAVGAFFGIAILFLSLATSQTQTVQYIEAEILTQNFTESETVVGAGLTLLSYDTRSTDVTTTKAEFDAGTYSNGQFIAAQDDVEAFVASDDYLTLGHYGDHAPNTSTREWWDDDADSATPYAWRYRTCFDVDNTASSDAMLEYQIYLDLDTATLVSAGKMLAGGDDIRFVNEDGDLLAFQIADDMNTTSTRMWLQIDDIPAGESESVCMYYGYTGGGSPTALSDEIATFSYTSAKEIYYVVAETADFGATNVISYADDNDITVSTYSGTLNQYDTAVFPSGITILSETSAISTTHPINGSYTANGTDNLVPVAAAGTSFVYGSPRYTNAFSIISPWCTASLTFTNGAGNNILDTTTTTASPFTVTAGSAVTITTNDTVANGLPNTDAVIIEEVGADCPVLITHHSTTGGDSYPLFPAANEWYGVGSGGLSLGVLQNGTSVTVYRSDGTTTGPTTYNRGNNVIINDTGSQGSEVAHRIVADGPIGVMAYADGDGGEATTFMPVDELGYTYYIADVSQYIAIATTAGISTTVDLYHDGTACGTGTPDATSTVSPTGNNPGKVYFGSTTTGDNIPAGACIVADNPIHAYNEYNGAGDEHNIWNEMQNRQFVGPAAPTYSVGAEEIGSWSIDGSNNWIRRVPVTVTNSTATALSDYQIFVDLGVDVATMFGKTQTDGGDIRVAGSLGDGTDDIVYSLENFNAGASTGDMWVRVPSIPASGNATFYIYYSPIGFDITSVSSILWLDAADTATITATSGSVSAWNDKSGAGNHVAQAVVASQPAVTTDGIHQVLAFNADYMADANGIWGATSHNDSYVFSVYKNLTLPENGALFYETLSAGARYGAWSPWGTTLYYQPGTGSYLTATYSGDTTTYHTMRYESHNGGNRTMARDGTILATDTAGAAFTGNNSSFNVAAYPGGTNPQSVNLAEMIVIDGTLTTPQIADIEAYLQQKWVTGPTTTLTTTGDHFAVFTTAVPKPNYHLVDEFAPAQTLSLISFADGNSVNDTITTQTVHEGEITLVPFGSGVLQSDVYSVTRPLHIDFTNDITDSAIPIGYAGTEFVYNVGRNSDVFSFYAPFADASVQIQESTGSGWATLQTVSVTAGTASSVSQDIVNTRTFKIVSDEPILAFHRNTNADSKVLYPTHLGLEADSGQYELYGIGTNTLTLASSSTANVTLYRSDGTSSTLSLNAANHYSYTEAGGGAQGNSMGYHIVSDAPIGASSYADSDGNEAVVFLSQKEFSATYAVTSPTQYMSIVARDASVTCRVYDAAGTEVTSGPATMDNVPPQTTGTQSDPYPNRLHIGGDDTSDGAFFSAGYSMTCTEPVYAFYEHHVDTSQTDETSWLSFPQGRTRNYIEPTVDDPDASDEEGLYFESGFDSAGAGTDPEATAEYIFDTSALLYGDDTYWRDIIWEEVTSNRSGENSVEEVVLEVAYASPSPTCAAATYGAFTALSDIATTSTSASVLTNEIRTTTVQRGMIDIAASDKACIKVRATLRTGDEAYAPALNEMTVGYYVPSILAGQTDVPTISVPGATGGSPEEYRVMKAKTNDAGLLGSEAFLTYHNVSTSAVFTQADTDIIEEGTLTVHPQFTFPPFPGATPVSAIDHAPFDASGDVSVYFTHERSSGALETIDFSLDIDIAAAGGPQLSRDFTLEVGGI